MQVKTLLNRVHPVKGCVYGNVTRVADRAAANGMRIEVELRSRKRSRGICSVCQKAGPTYDRLPARRFGFVPLWGIAVMLVYALRRIECPSCGVKVERVPWCQPGSKSPMTTALKVFLSRWAKLLSWRQVSVCFAVSWDSVYRAVEEVVAYGLAHRDLSGIGAIGVDEVAHAKGHKYLTLVYQLDSGSRRLLHVSRGRSVRSLLEFFRMLKNAKVDYANTIKFVCSDMWRAYLKVIGKKLPQALHILDRYHIVANLGQALDQVRAEEARTLKEQGWDVLKHSRWLLLRLLLLRDCGVAFPEQHEAPPAESFGVVCPGQDGMVSIPSIRGRPAFCIDRYEATGTGALGNPDQSAGNEGSTMVVALSARFSQPLTKVSWFQAQAACRNARKRLCTPDEWVVACRGSEDVTYPYGDGFEPTTCNGFGAGRDAPVETGAMFSPVLNDQGSLIARGCVSSFGVYDLSGNAWEWNAGLYLEGSRRGLAGGSFRSNAAGLRCVTDDNHEVPTASDGAYGFRCCSDYPR